MQTLSETLVDENGIELIVGYEYDKTEPYYEEPGNVASFVEPTVETTLHSVEVVIAGKGVDILNQLTEQQKQSIVSKLDYE